MMPLPSEVLTGSKRFQPSFADLISCEAVYVLFLFSGRYKSIPELRGFPVDFTLLFFAVTCCFVAGAFVSGRMRTTALSMPVLSLLSFCALAAASLFWSSMDELNVDKSLRFLLFTSSSFFAAVMFAQDKERRDRLFRLVIWISCAMLVYYGYYRFVIGIDPMADPSAPDKYLNGVNYLEYSDHARILFISCLCLAAFGSPKQMSIAVFGSGAALYALLAIGGRGHLTFGLLAVPLTVLGLLVRPSGGRQAAMRLATLSAIVVMAAVGYVAFDTDHNSDALQQMHTLERYEEQFSGEETHSMDMRMEGQQDAFRKWQEKPVLGWGIGEFRVQHNELAYPHNLLLEILMEIGLVGAFLFFFVCAVAVIDCVRMARQAGNWVDAAIILLFLTDLAAHVTVAGYLADDRDFFAYMGLVIGSCRGRGGRPPRTIPVR
jgi:O-antigen ligase